MSISVSSGSVVASGSPMASGTSPISTWIPRPTWIFPIDGSNIYANVNNILAWTAIPNAVYYIIEYNLPGPVFVSDNVASPENWSETITVAPSYSGGNPYIHVNLDSSYKGKTIEARIFACDAQGKILKDTVSSDKITVQCV